MKKPFTTIAVGVFALVALLLFFRLAFGWEVTFQGGVVPLWVAGWALPSPADWRSWSGVNHDDV